MKWTDISGIRLHSHRIAGKKCSTPQQAVAWMGAIQSQDFNMSKWAVGLRTQSPLVGAVEKAINTAVILRTHLLRPTWHLVHAQDVHWLLELSAPRIRAGMKSRNKQLELTPGIFSQAARIFEKALANGHYHTREELVHSLTRAGIAVNENRAAHLLMEAELGGLICSGPMQQHKSTYALLHEWVPRRSHHERDEALGLLALRYFRSRGPATIDDFAWWSGLTATDCRRGLDAGGQGLKRVSVDHTTFWFDAAADIPAGARSSPELLPGYDEFIIAYKDRSPVMLAEHGRKVISRNGIFWPALAVNGQVAGIWKRTENKGRLSVALEYLKKPSQSLPGAIRTKARAYARFWGVPLEAVHFPGD